MYVVCVYVCLYTHTCIQWFLSLAHFSIDILYSNDFKIIVSLSELHSYYLRNVQKFKNTIPIVIGAL